MTEHQTGPAQGPPAGPAKPHAYPDELEAAKQQLLAASEERKSEHIQKLIDFVDEHPYASAGIALASGFFCGYIPALRKAVGVIGMWGAKRAVLQYLHQQQGKDRRQQR